MLLAGRDRRAGFLLHPLLIGAVTGGLAGDLSMGWITGIAVSPWSEALGRGRPSLAAALGAAIGAASGVLLSWPALVGGFLVEAFAGGVIGVAVAVSLSAVEERLAPPSPRGIAAGAVGATACLWLSFALLETWPELVRAGAPTLSGAAMVVGLGALCGRRGESPGSDARAAGGLGVLLLGNFAGPLGLLALPALYPLDRLAPPKQLARGLVVVLAIAVAVVMAWLPYQLPSQTSPLIPGTREAIGPVTAFLLMPLTFTAGLAAALVRRPVLGLLALPVLAPMLIAGL